MQVIGEWLQATWQWFCGLWVAQPLTMMLISGLAILTTTLFVLMRTRLGQIKPLWTCAALSILAHVLLMGYFYATQLMFSVPAAGDDVVRFQLIEQVADMDDAGDEKQDQESSNLLIDSVEEEPLVDLNEPVDSLEPMDVVSTTPVPQIDLKSPTIEPRQALVESDMADRFSEFQPLLPQEHSWEAQVDVPKTQVDRSDVESQVAAEPLEINKPEIDSQPAVSREIEGEFEPELAQPEFRMTQPDDLMPVEPKPLEFDIDDQLQKLADQETVKFESENSPTANSDPAVSSDDSQPFEWRPADGQVTQARSNQRVPVRPATMVRAGDGKPLPAIYQARTEAKSDQWLHLAGGSAKTELAVEAALEFLSQAQESDGRWDASRFGGGLERNVLGHDRQGAGKQADTAVTALSVLAMMAAGNTHLSGTHAKSVQRGLEFLLGAQQADGSLAGDALLFSQMYCHSMSMLALSEAYAMSGDPRLRNAVQRAVDYSLRAQNPQDGGWRYKPGDAGDMSQFGWHVMAMKSASLGGIDVPEVTWQRMKMFLESCTSGQHRGLAAYRPGEGASRVMTAEALVCRYFLDAEINNNLVNEATGVLMDDLPGKGSVNYYYWYYGTLATNLAGGQAWDNWNQAMTEQLLKMQRQDGVLKGSFDANGVWSGYGGRIYSTAMATLCLESYYRYLPAMKIDDNR